jgi:hypothetical protein
VALSGGLYAYLQQKDFEKKVNLTELSQHTGISFQHLFHSTIIPPWRVSWVSREADKLKKLLFVCLVRCFSVEMEWHSKNLQKLSKSTAKLLFFRIFSEFVQFWLGNRGPNQLDELKLTILLLLTPKPSLKAE